MTPIYIYTYTHHGYERSKNFKNSSRETSKYCSGPYKKISNSLSVRVVKNISLFCLVPPMGKATYTPKAAPRASITLHYITLQICTQMYKHTYAHARTHPVCQSYGSDKPDADRHACAHAFKHTRKGIPKNTFSWKTHIGARNLCNSLLLSLYSISAHVGSRG